MMHRLEGFIDLGIRLSGAVSFPGLLCSISSHLLVLDLVISLFKPVKFFSLDPVQPGE